ncbi:unnamed protein product [Pieris brassicae]|uniref:Uncharacterized protein n=1 Tax=Pieris brassicae TaxID=7116 RepID=A0A9P0XC76_PIEBR|nr:unnamed protein product [Pieris brassicae]
MCKLATKGVTEVYLWSVNCGGQNRSRIVFYMYNSQLSRAAIKLKNKIGHRFMEKGHTHDEGDSVNALIEKIGERLKKGIVAKNWTKSFSTVEDSWNKIKEIEASLEEEESEGVLSYEYSLGDEERQQIECFKKLGTRRAVVCLFHKRHMKMFC